MRVILKKDTDKLGKFGQIVEVSDGYGRNYLIPRGLVWPDEEKYRRRIDSLRQKLEAEKLKQKETAQQKAQQIESVSLTIEAEAGQDEKLFGAVTNIDITEKMKEAGIDIDKKDVQIDEPIKKLGVYKVNVRLHPEIEAVCKVWVVKK